MMLRAARPSHRTARAGKGYLSRDVLPVAALRLDSRAAVLSRRVPGLRSEMHGEAAAPEPSRARAPCGLAQYALYLGKSFGADRHDNGWRRAQKKAPEASAAGA